MVESINYKHENNGLSKKGESFIDFLEKFYAKNKIGELRNKDEILQACLRMEEIHQGQERKNKTPYHIHPYIVARIYCLAHKKNISETGIIAALLHDNIENSKKSGIREDYDSIEKTFGFEDALICSTLSKTDISDKNQRNIEYFERFQSLKTIKIYVTKLAQEKSIQITKAKIRQIAFKIAIIKLCDRIHNMRTMNNFKKEKIRIKIDETNKYLLALAREVGETHPIILLELNEALVVAEQEIVKQEVSHQVSS